MEIIQTKDPKKNRVVKAGEVDGVVFRRSVKNNHGLRLFKDKRGICGYALQADVLTAIREIGVKQIQFVKPNGVEYWINFQDFDRYKVFFNQGHGDQWAIPGKYLARKGERSPIRHD